MPQPTWTLDRIINILLYLGGIVLFLWLLNYLSPYIASFFLALFFAYLLEPLVRFFRIRLRVKKRWLAVLLSFLTIIGVLTLVGFIVVPSVNSEVGKLREILGGDLALQYQEVVPSEVRRQIDAILNSEEVAKLLSEENITTYGSTILSYLWSVISGAAGMLLGLFSIVTFLLYLAFIMLFYNDFSDNWEDAIPPAYRKPAVMLINDVEEGMQVYFRGQAQVVLWVCILFSVGFKLIGLPLGILLGIFVGLLNFVPYLQTLGLIPAVLLAGIKSLETGQDFWAAAGLVLLVFLLVQAIQEIVLVPRILGGATGLNPAVILLALSVWGGLFGIIGMIIALPMTSLLINYYKRFVLKREPGR
ncbi:MAG: AI-2E family transporter [Phaeodactylibacter sp.]|nr:AI-2E family transporter [Phaeodactylibacter sp.]